MWVEVVSLDELSGVLLAPSCRVTYRTLRKAIHWAHSVVRYLLALPREPEVREVSVFEVGYRYPVSGYRAYPVPPLIPACPVGLPPLLPLRIVQTRSSLVFYAVSALSDRLL